jgi:hypothetical protein
MKTPEEIAYDYGEKFDGVEISKSDINIAWYDGYKAAQEAGSRSIGWVSVKKSLPDTLQQVLIDRADGIKIAYILEGTWYLVPRTPLLIEPTRWHSLPDLSKDRK